MNDLISRSALLEAFGEEPLVWDSRDREDVQMRNDWLDYTKLVKEAPAVDAGPKWISVEDRLPEKSGDYLAFTEKGIFMVLSYSEIHRAFNAYDWCENVTPIRCTHWMPLLEVPHG